MPAAIQFAPTGVEVSMAQEDAPLPVTSSAEPTWSAEAHDCYRSVLETLTRERVPCAVGGAFALHEHTGIWRTTKDLDLLMEAKTVPPALALLREAGFETWIKDPIWLAKAMRGDYFVDFISGVGNATLPVESSWIERALPGQVLGVPCRILAVEEMIASKVFVTRRERFDGSDVAHLIRARGERVDWERVLQLIDRHWMMLYWSLVLYAYIYPAETDKVPERIWQQLSQRFVDEVRLPRRDEAFRGMLVDPKMFAIDVSEWGLYDLYREYCDRHPRPVQDLEPRAARDKEEAA
ncbi:MAG: nucleotidyltransferase [Acidobacteriaceae bacterium]